ncbi:hypothetical protein ACHAQH_005418 [Verticillium albo-atrum]
MAFLAIPAYTWQPAEPRHHVQILGQTFPILKLPPELRYLIWEHALPTPRVYEVLDAPEANQATPAFDGLIFANIRHEPPPPLAAVCHETRAFVLRRYRALTLSGITKYVDLGRDMILLEPYLLVKRLLRTLHFLTQIPLVRNSLTRLALGTSYGVHTGLCHPILSWKVSKANMSVLLSRLAKLPKLEKLLFVVHQEFQFEWNLCMSSGKDAHLAAPPPPFWLQNPMDSTPAVRPQLIHQGYRFKFDIETHINHHYPRLPHHNAFLYYPLDIDEDADEEHPETDAWPTNDDWRRFRRKFQKAAHASFETQHAKGSPKIKTLPALEGASLLWRYMSTPPIK